MNLLRWTALASVALAMAYAHAAPTIPRVVVVQPSGDRIPANLLRISIRFAHQVDSPMIRRISLLRADGSKVYEPFLEQELWSPDGEVLTVLMHPGRVKSGLRAREEIGPILEMGERVALVLDGLTIKRWSVGAADSVGPAPAMWRLSGVSSGSRGSLVVTLDKPIDGQDVNYLAVVDSGGRRVSGRAKLRDGEGEWTFTPDTPWRAGTFRLMVRGTLEDPAGNRLGGHFETPISSAPGTEADAAIIFTVGPRTK